jgi:hypothetical protein
MPTLARITHQQPQNGSAGSLHLGVVHIERLLLDCAHCRVPQTGRGSRQGIAQTLRGDFAIGDRHRHLSRERRRPANSLITTREKCRYDI